jgi:hypothetical protein
MQRLIILGASNVTRSFGRLLSMAEDALQGPLEVLAAHGHGRSYGAPWSTVLVRQLPGILHCGLWEAIRKKPSALSSALVTDIGNDILYEYPVVQVADWVERCFDQLRDAVGKIVVSALPIQNLEGLSAARYKIFRGLLMPGCSLSLSETTHRAVELNERVRALADARGISIVLPRREWYGVDPIHIRRRACRVAWQALLEPLRSNAEAARFSREKRIERILLRTRLPERVRWFGKSIHTPQPSARLSDGTTVSIY